MRIIAGKFKSRTIRTIESMDTRPVMDRIKESIFNILVHNYSIIDAEVLDLFAGSGSFGLEALSRGAALVTFVEKSPEAIKYLKENISKLKCDNECVVKSGSVEQFLAGNKKEFDLIFCDPPFKMENPLEIVKLILKYNALSDNSILVFRSEDKNSFEFDGYELIMEKVYGRNIVYFLRKI